MHIVRKYIHVLGTGRKDNLGEQLLNCIERSRGKCHSDTLSWFRANQSLLWLLNDACLEEKLQIPFA